MPGGYMGRIARIDLTQNRVTTRFFSDEVLRKYIGGSGLGARILYDETSEKTDPLGSENVLVFMTGPLVGTPAPNFGRHQVVTKSPLTGAYGEANSGGTWGYNLKRAGYDGLILVGMASRPVYIWINEGEVEIRDAAHLWGKDTYETDALLKAELGAKITTCSIGQAGENLVRIAAIMNDGIDGRAAGRCGVGAVMGSKKVKAIAVQGSRRSPIVRDDELKASVRNWNPRIKKSTEPLGEFGTSVGMMTVEAIGDLPVKNWSRGSFPGAEKISGQTLAKTILTRRYFCAQCVIGCGRTVKVTEGPYQGVEGAGPEYETLGMLGANCLIDDLAAVAKANELCNRFGLDTISTGACISFAIEAFENGLITREQTGDVDLKWGDAEAMLQMIPKIALRQDIGHLLGEGTRIASQRLGGVAPELAVHVRGLEFPAHDPRAKYSNALAYATSARGACHLNAFSYEFEMGATMPELGYPETLDRFTIEGKGEFVAKFQDLMALFDSLTGCKFVVFGLGDKTVQTMAEWLNMVTGWDVTAAELLRAGARAVTLKRMYNIRCGQSRKDDVLPPRMVSHMRGEGGAADNLPPLGRMLSDYYAYRGWNEFGIPTEEALRDLGII